MSQNDMSDDLREEAQYKINKMKSRSQTEKKMKTDREARQQEIAEKYGIGSYDEFYVEYRNLPTELQNQIDETVTQTTKIDIRTMLSDLSAAAWVDHIN